MKAQPPKRALKFLRWFCREDYLEEIEGDLTEIFEIQYGESPKKANRKFIWSVIRYFRPEFIKSLSNSQKINPTDMFRHNIIISLRSFKRNKTYSLINTFGLSLGITCAILIFTLVKYHLSFDTFHTKSDRIYRIITELHREEIGYNRGVPSPIGEAINNDFSFAEKKAMVAGFSEKLVTISSLEDHKKFKENIAFAEPAFFEIMDFPLIHGNKKTILSKANTAIITERIAKKYFGNHDPIGKSLQIDKMLDVVVTGVLRNIPANTDRIHEIYLPFHNLKDHSPWLVEKDWWYSVNKSLQCFVLLKPNVSPGSVNQALIAISEKYYEGDAAKFFQFRLQHLSDIHFNPNLDGYVKKENLWILSFIGLFLIITACVNFVNLATAQAIGRSREIGVKKTLGGIRSQIFWQFMTETSLITIAAMFLALVMAYGSLPYLNQLFNISLNLDLLHDVNLSTFLLILLFIVIFFSGAYPGLILSRFRPITALKGQLSQKNKRGISLRRGLVISQFVISQVLIIGTIVVANQMRFTENMNLGFDKEAIVMLPIPDNQSSKINTLGNQLSQLAGVEKLSFCDAAPASDFIPTTGIQYGSRTESEKFYISPKAGDHQYVPTFELEILTGRNLQSSDTVREFLINETTVKKLNVASKQEVIGKNAIMNGKKGTIVGVVKDFHNQSLHGVIDPVYITTLRNNYGSCAVKVKLSQMVTTLVSIEEIWKEMYPEDIYEYEFLDERIARFYEIDIIMFRLITFFTNIAILIGCLGLYGLILFMTTQKTREVGVRKVLGASVQHILWLFGKEFIRLLAIAFLIAAPLAWWIMQNWLEDFTYHIEISPSIFILAILIVTTIAMFTIGYVSIKAAFVNPIKSLKSD